MFFKVKIREYTDFCIISEFSGVITDECTRLQLKKKKKSNVDCLSAFQLKEREKEGGGGKCIHMHLSA